jgi:25S rRNA (adenine2142-N1)-methyltransferase
MPKTRRRKTPITRSSEIGQASSSSPFSSRALIRGFHVLLKKQAQLRGLPYNEENVKALDNIDREIEELGGLAAYQRMSSIGQGDDRGGGSEKVLISWLREMGMSSGQTSKKLRYVYANAAYGHTDLKVP